MDRRFSNEAELEYGKLKHNFIYNILYQASIYIAPLAVTPYLSRVLGADRVGRYSFAQSIVSYFILLATLGTTYYGQRKIAAAQRDPRERTRIFYEIALLRGSTTLAALAVYLIAVVPGSVDARLYTVAGLEILSVGIDISWFFQGMESFGVIALTNCAAKVLSIALIFLCVKSSEHLTLYVAIYCGTILLGFLCQWLFLPRCLAGGIRPAFSNEKLHVKIALGLFVAQVAVQIYTVLDKTMIGLITRSELENGYYEQAQKLIRILVAVSTSVSTVMASRIASLWAERKREEIRELLGLSFRIVCCISLPVCCVIQLCVERFVPWFYGPGYDSVGPLLRALSLQPFIIGCSSVVGMQFFVPTGREKYLTLSVAAGSLVNLALNFLFISRWQALGAAAASVLAEITVTGIQFYLARGELNLKKLPGMALHYLLLCLPMLAVGYGVKRLTAFSGTSAVLTIAACCIVYALLLVICRDPLLTALIARKTEDAA